MKQTFSIYVLPRYLERIDRGMPYPDYGVTENQHDLANFLLEDVQAFAPSGLPGDWGMHLKLAGQPWWLCNGEYQAWADWFHRKFWPEQFKPGLFNVTFSVTGTTSTTFHY